MQKFQVFQTDTPLAKQTQLAALLGLASKRERSKKTKTKSTLESTPAEVNCIALDMLVRKLTGSCSAKNCISSRNLNTRHATKLTNTTSTNTNKRMSQASSQQQAA